MANATLLQRRTRTSGSASKASGPRDVVDSFSSDQVSRLASLLKLLGDENRLAIVCRLRYQSEMNVGQLSLLACQSQPAVSHHLAVLRQAGLIECRRQGKHRYYRLSRRGRRCAQTLLEKLAGGEEP